MSFKKALSSAALLFAAATGAGAADLPRTAPAQYVKVCNTYGDGFFYIPGTQTCLQLSGYVRADAVYFEPTTRANDGVFFATRARINVDARTETAYGTLRSFIRLQGNRAGGNAVNGNGNIFYPVGNGSFQIDKAFLQLGGLTAGYAVSFFDFYANANTLNFLQAGSDVSANTIAYTATFGNGFTATLGIEERNWRVLGFDNTVYAGQTMPSVVANVRVEQAWGAAQISGAVQHLRPLATTDSDYGFAVQAGVMFNLPMLAKGDTLYLQASYADGAIGYLGPVFTAAIDGFALVSGVRRTTGYALTAELMHFWTPSVKSVFGASYLNLDNSVLAATPDSRTYGLFTNLVWSPVADLDLGVEVGYYNTKFTALPEVDAVVGTVRVERRF